jgi:hypothetical protein
VTTTSVRIEASAHFDPSGRFIPSAERLANAITLALRTTNHVEVSFVKLRGLPSGYFNTALLGVANELGRDAIEQRISFVFENTAQRETFQRSQRAVLNSLGGGK